MWYARYLIKQAANSYGALSGALDKARMTEIEPEVVRSQLERIRDETNSARSSPVGPAIGGGLLGGALGALAGGGLGSLTGKSLGVGLGALLGGGVGAGLGGWAGYGTPERARKRLQGWSAGDPMSVALDRAYSDYDDDGRPVLRPGYEYHSSELQKRNKELIKAILRQIERER